MKTLKTIDIQAKEWFDKINGNSYFAGTVTVNYGMLDEKTFKMPFKYGYGSQYEQEAFKILADNGIIEQNEYNGNKTPKSRHELKEIGIIVRSYKQTNCKQKELKNI